MLDVAIIMFRLWGSSQHDQDTDEQEHDNKVMTDCLIVKNISLNKLRFYI